MVTEGYEIDGNCLIRRIGRGGFGEVWLTKNEFTGIYQAVKLISTSDFDYLDVELEALKVYSMKTYELQSEYLLEIFNVNMENDFLYYFMPLSAGVNNVDPSDPAWEPMTMESMIQKKLASRVWFSWHDIVMILQDVVAGVKELKKVGLNHGDIKPSNILFYEATDSEHILSPRYNPRIADIGLVSAVGSEIKRGTNYYAAPTWYLESGGDPDMYGLAVSLYRLMTGQPPENISKIRYMWPVPGKKILGTNEQKIWEKIRKDVILKATHEDPHVRFRNYDEFLEGLSHRG
jgi:serine/threonine protein kinase